MAQTADIANIPVPSKEKGQRSIPISEAYFARIIPSWSQPSQLTPDQWRAWVKSQPVAVTCKETMKSNLADLDWKVTPRESDQRDELKGTIKHYEKLLQRGGYSGVQDWVGFIERSLEDLLDLPFGSVWEVGRKGDSPDGRVMWLEPVDGGTCYPTNNKKFPVFQYYNGYQATFPEHAVARMYLNPRAEIERQGWGIAPPELIFMALEMLMRGDRYYANLLLDIPPAGVFDLGDITWDDAHTWIASFRSAITGVGSADAFKIPVLAEHNGKVEFISLGKAPNDIMYDRITLKYASLVTAGYGMNLGDIGIQSASSSGETLAGSIRGEQKTNRTGKARYKAKIKYLIESFLPDTLQFDFIDTDGERLSMLGRARLANATAMNQYREMEAISPEEARLQAIQDGLFTISMPEKPPKEAKKELPVLGQTRFGKPGQKPPERPGQVGPPQPPSMGGDGEVKKSYSFLPSKVDQAVERIVSALAPNIRETLNEVGEDDFGPMKSLILNTVFSQEDELDLASTLGSMMKDIDFMGFDLSGVEDVFAELLQAEGLHAVNLDRYAMELESRCRSEFPAFLGKAIVYALVNSESLFSGDVVENVQTKVRKSLADYASTFVGIEVNRIFEEIKASSLEVPETLRVKSVISKAPNNTYISTPDVKMPEIRISVPERSVNIGSPNVHIEQPDVNVNVNPTPVQIMNDVEVNPTPVEIRNTVQAGDVSIDVNPTPVSITNEVQVEKSDVNVNVNPTPVEIRNDVTVKPADVNIPKPIREIQTVHRDQNKDIAGTVTEVEYDE